jgi:NTP pyrophosphatase (non-canonical NTP hydrolase)
MKEYQQMLMDFTKDRPIMAENNTQYRLFQLLKSEVIEAEESDDEHLASELADILIFTLSIANLHGYDMDAEVREKIALNMVRYQARYFQEGDYEESRKLVKSLEGPILEEFYSI